MCVCGNYLTVRFIFVIQFVFAIILPVANLPNGILVLNVIVDGYSYKKKLIKK